MKGLLIICLLLFPFFAGAQQPAQNSYILSVDSFVSQKEGSDTLRYLNILGKFVWTVKISNKDGSARRFTTTRVDTIRSKEIDSVYMSAIFTVSPQLAGQELAFDYDVTGSVLMKLNGTPILTTGVFAKNKKPGPGYLEQSDFASFIIKDTIEKAEITYIPHPRIREFFLKLIVFQATKGYYDYYKAVSVNSTVEYFAIGVYYLAFGIIFFIMFFFYRGNKENLHFALFCLFIAAAFVCGDFFDGLYAIALSVLSAIFALEFVCIFFARVFRNRKRTRVPLIIICLIAVVSLSPPVLYRYASFFSDERESMGLFFISRLLFVYEIYLLFYLLAWGLRRRNREALPIFIFGLIASFLYLLLPWIFSLMPEFRNLSFLSYSKYIPEMGLCFIPIGAVIVLGKRNGETQKALLEQEQEKKRLLENRKEELEKEVALRTEEIMLQKDEIEKQHDELKKEKRKSDELLLNILPAEVAEELKEKGTSEAKFFDNVTVLFTDFVDFTKAGETMGAQALVDELHTCFKAFDEIISRYNIEKIKTIGDAYLAVCGLPAEEKNHAANVALAALDIRQFMTDRKKELGDRTFDIRIGIHSGSVVAGIVGVKKFAYDIWGDTVNTAARMEQHSETGKINISQITYELIKDRFVCTYRGKITAKNKGEMSMYFIEKASLQYLNIEVL